MFVRLTRYKKLALHCLKEQKRTQDAEYQIKQLLADNDTLGRLVMYYKAKSDRLEQADKPRDRGGRYVGDQIRSYYSDRIIQINNVQLADELGVK